MNKPMTFLIAAFAIAGVWTTSGLAQTDVPDQSGTTADAPRKSRPARTTKSLDPVRGAFHRVHKLRLKMGCSDCHSTTQDTLFLRKDDVVPTAMRGQVDRKVCLGCHTAPAKPAWYGLGR